MQGVTRQTDQTTSSDLELHSGLVIIFNARRRTVVTRTSTCRHILRGSRRDAHLVTRDEASLVSMGMGRNTGKVKMGRQPRSGDSSLAIGPFDPDWDRR